MPTIDCTDTCHASEKYNYNESNAFSLAENSVKQIRYGTGEVLGFYAKDDLCLTQDHSTCLEKFKMLSVF
jgi:hypothetical protein